MAHTRIDEVRVRSTKRSGERCSAAEWWGLGGRIPAGSREKRKKQLGVAEEMRTKQTPTSFFAYWVTLDST